MVEIAVQKALVERVVVRIEVASDVFPKDIAGEHYSHPLVHSLPVFAPPSSQLKKAADILSSGTRVTVYCGIGCRDSKAEVLALAESWAHLLGTPCGQKTFSIIATGRWLV